MNHMTLLELNGMVRQTIDSVFPETCWLQAELSEARESRGHCYLEFVQKDKLTNALLAKARGQIWAGRWAYIRPYFIRAAGQPLSAGMQVLVQVQVTFHELYGYSLNVLDIDPTYTLGDIARRRKEILQVLHDEGVDTMNKELPLPTLLQRIAVISSATAAGYEDFCNQLTSNPQQLAFQTKLFPSVMQGDGVEQGVIRALNQIAREADLWDVVVIIRGGGSTSDLSGFDSLLLAENVVQFPLPVITGIGHERDDTVIDMIAHTRVKTPTAAAEFLIHHQQEQLNLVLDCSGRLHSATNRTLVDAMALLGLLTRKLPALATTAAGQERQRINRLSLSLQNAAVSRMEQHRSRVDLLCHALKTAATTMLLHRKNRLALLQGQIKAADPVRMLRLGFSITRSGGRVVSNLDALPPGAFIETETLAGTIESQVVKTTKRTDGIRKQN